MNKDGKRDDSDYEEEESLVLVELSGIMEADLLPKVRDCKVLGIDTEKPLIQLDNYVFQGEYEDAMGTCMLFEEKKVPDTDNDGELKKELNLKHLTHKKLCMQRVFIKKRNQGGEPAQAGEGDGPSEQMEVDSSCASSLHQGTSSSSRQSGITSATDIPQLGASTETGTVQSDIISDSRLMSGSEVEEDTQLPMPGSISQTGSTENSVQIKSSKTGSNCTSLGEVSQSEIQLKMSTSKSKQDSGLSSKSNTSQEQAGHGEGSGICTKEVHTQIDIDRTPVSLQTDSSLEHMDKRDSGKFQSDESHLEGISEKTNG